MNALLSLFTRLLQIFMESVFLASVTTVHCLNTKTLRSQPTTLALHSGNREKTHFHLIMQLFF